MNMKSIAKDAVILFAITLIAGVLLGGVHEITLEPIRKAQEEAANATYSKIFESAETFESAEELADAIEACNADPELQTFGSNVSVNEVLKAKDASGNQVGYIVIAQAKGYGGPVESAVGLDMDGTITGLGFITINETPGLGMKAKDAAFTDQFKGMADGKSMQAISGATFTSKAVRGDVIAAQYFFNNYAE